MGEETKDKDPTIKVVDRRAFTPDGRRREPDPRSPAEASAPQSAAKGGNGPENPPSPAKPDSRPAPAQAGAVLGAGFTMENPAEPSPFEDLPGGEDPAFMNLLVSLYQSGCIHLGLVQEEGAPPQPPDLEGARGAIEMLSMIRRKTAGNLAREETQILESLLAELQMAYAMKAPGG